jgi:aminocarboxymuconate-semialdehyde decarboxylase
VTNAAEPLSPSGGGTAPRRQVVLDGRRVKTVNVHAHCAVPEAMTLMGMAVSPQALLIGPERLRAMDAQGIDVEALSINPY